MSVKITEDEKKAFAHNEEKLWDLAAITAAPTLFQWFIGLDIEDMNDFNVTTVTRISYDLADALILERRKRLKSIGPETSGVS